MLFKLNKKELPESIRERTLLHSQVYAKLMQHFNGKKYTLEDVNEYAYNLLKPYFEQGE